MMYNRFLKAYSPNLVIWKYLFVPFLTDFGASVRHLQKGTVTRCNGIGISLHTTSNGKDGSDCFSDSWVYIYLNCLYFSNGSRKVAVLNSFSADKYILRSKHGPFVNKEFQSRASDWTGFQIIALKQNDMNNYSHVVLVVHVVRPWTGLS